MHRFNIPAIFKFAIGVLLVQGATALLVIAAQRADLRDTWLLMLALGLLIGVLAAFWFSSIASHCSQHAVAKVSEKFSKDRDRLRRQTEKEKTREIRESHRQLLRETRRFHGRSSRKLAAGLGGLAALGVTLVFTQFVTLGLLALSLGGGALLGYAVRSRQNRLTGRSPAPAPTVVDDRGERGVLLPPINSKQRKTHS
ncbi:MAG: hypothetical protein PVI91_04610 [Gammaproteobacteria bacterium]